MRVQRHTNGSVRYDKRRKTWNYLWYDGPTRRSRRIGTKQEFPTKAAAWKAVERLETITRKAADGETVRSVAARYEVERMPSRHSTARVYRGVLKNHVLPKWGDAPIQDIQPRPVELWLRGLPLSGKSKTHVRSMMHSIVEFAMWAGMLEISRNPISLVRNIGATGRVRHARSLTVEQYQALRGKLQEPFATMSLLCVCLGLRISEALALKWSDVDWLGSRLSVRRAIVNKHVDDCKTKGSARTFALAGDLLNCLKVLKQSTKFSAPDDWVFASPFKLGRLPFSYTGTRQELTRAAKLAGIGAISSHAFRHTFRTWLGELKTPIAVQQQLMRHSDIRMTMNTYGTVFDDVVDSAGEKVAILAFGGNRAPEGAHRD